MTHYWVVYAHENRTGTCRTDIDDARMDIIDELKKGLDIALKGESLWSIREIADAISSASSLDPRDEYAGYESISKVEVGHREWWIEQNWTCSCGNEQSRGGSW